MLEKNRNDYVQKDFCKTHHFVYLECEQSTSHNVLQRNEPFRNFLTNVIKP